MSDLIPKTKRTLLPDLFLGALLFFLLVLFYQPALHGGLLFDDDRHLTPLTLRSWTGLWRIWFEPGATFQYYPVLHSFYWLEQRFWGDALFGYHLASLTLHAATAFLLVALMRRLSLPGAWLAAFIFALHPICVESVAWISEQKNTLSAFFFLASAFIYLGFIRSRSRSAYFAATALFMMALLSKTVTATLPGVLLVIFWWQRRPWKKEFLPLLPWLITGAAGGLVSGWIERNFYGATGASFSLTVPQHLILAGREIWFYFGKIIWPSDLMFHYPHWEINVSEWINYLPLFALLCLLLLFLNIANWNRAPLALLLIFMGILFPVLGFLNIAWFNFSYVADHFAYLASLVVIVPASTGAAMFMQKSLPARWITRLSLGLILLIFSASTWNHCHAFSDMELLYRITLQKNPNSSMSHFNYGLVLVKMPGRLPEALDQFRTAQLLRPDDAVTHAWLGKILLDTKMNHDEAVTDLERALQINPNYAEAHYLLGRALEDTPDRKQEAMAHYKRAIELGRKP